MSRPYNYEGNELRINNPFTGVQINQLTNGTFNFNLPGSIMSMKQAQNFANFYELYTYYTQHTTKKIARVHQTYFKPTTSTNVKVPSFLDILGVSLIIVNVRRKHVHINFKTDILLDIFNTLLQMSDTDGRIVEMTIGTSAINHTLKSGILTVLKKNTYPLQITDITPLAIDSINEADVLGILEIFKKAIFFYRYGIVPSTKPTFNFNNMNNVDINTVGLLCLGTEPGTPKIFKTNTSTEGFLPKSELYKEITLQAATIDADKGVMVSDYSSSGSAKGGRKRTKPKKGTIKPKKGTIKHKRTRRTRRTRRKY